MERTGFTILLLLLWNISNGKSYHLSNNGNDENDGSRTAPWCSLEKLHASLPLLKPGDSILFERGSVFRGELNLSIKGTSQNPVYIGAYGTGATPVITGSHHIETWMPVNANIWTATCTSCTTYPSNLFINGKSQPLGRYPDDGYLKASSQPSDSTSIVDTSTRFPDGHWNNAEVVIRSKHWVLDNLTVASYKQSSFRFSVPASYSLKDGATYFIQKHIATLNRHGEWHFDVSQKRIYLYLKDSADPNKQEVELSVNDTGLSLHNSAFVVVENISLERYNVAGAEISNSHHIIFKNNNITWSGINGLKVESCSSPCVENNRIADSHNNGVEWRNNEEGIFSWNHISRTGIRAGRGSGGNGTYNAVNILGNTTDKQNWFQHNAIDSTGYLGIDFRTGHTYIKNNVVTNFCLVKDDGAGIYTWGNHYGNNVIEGNIILGRTHRKEILKTEKSYANGIYIDDRSRNIQIKNNTVAYCPAAGIFIHNANFLNISGNTLFSNGENLFNREKGQLLIRRDGLAPSSEWDIKELEVQDNRFVATRNDQYAVYLIGRTKDDLLNPGSFLNNEYIIPRPSNAIAWDYEYNTLCHAPEELALKDWQNIMKQDKNSVAQVVPEASFRSAGNNLIKNSNLSKGTHGWIIWPEEAAVQQDNKEGMQGASLKLEFTDDIPVFLYHSGFRMTENKIYRLSFTAMSTEKMKLEFVPMMASNPWKALGDYTCFTLLPEPREFTYYFQPVSGSTEARVNFRSNKTFWIDNIRLLEVDPEETASHAPMVFLYNTSHRAKEISLNQHTNLRNQESIVLPAYSSEIILSENALSENN